EVMEVSDGNCLMVAGKFRLRTHSQLISFRHVCDRKIYTDATDLSHWYQYKSAPSLRPNGLQIGVGADLRVCPGGSPRYNASQISVGADLRVCPGGSPRYNGSQISVGADLCVCPGGSPRYNGSQISVGADLCVCPGGSPRYN